MAASERKSPVDRLWTVAEFVSRKLSGAALVLAGIGLLLMTLLILADVVLRALANLSLLVSFEYSGYLMALLSFLGATHSLKSGGFVRVDALYQSTEGIRRELLDLGIALIGALYVAILAYDSWQFALRSYNIGTRSIAITETPLWIPQILMCAGLSLLLFELGFEVVRILIRIGRPPHPV